MQYIHNPKTALIYRYDVSLGKLSCIDVAQAAIVPVASGYIADCLWQQLLTYTTAPADWETGSKLYTLDAEANDPDIVDEAALPF